MKNMRKVISFILFLALVTDSWTPAFAAANSMEKEAKQLNDLGLYKGTSTTGFDPDLESKLDRQTGVVMLLRVFGSEQEADAMGPEEVVSKLARFTDADTISSWARNQVAYAVEKGFVNGMPDGSFRPDSALTGNQISKMILEGLGYDVPDFPASAQQLARLHLIAGVDAAALPDPSAPLVRGQAVELCFATLQLTPNGGSKSLIESLAERGVISRDAAVSSGLIVTNPTKTEDDADTDRSSSRRHRSNDNTDTTAPTFTVTAASIDAGDDTVTLIFSKAMNISAVPTVQLYLSDDQSITAEPFGLTNAAVTWIDSTTLKVTLDETTDHEYIYSNYIGASTSAIGANGVAADASLVFSDAVELENIAPQLSSWSLDSTTKLLTLTFNEPIWSNSDYVDVEGITLSTSSAIDGYPLTPDTTTGSAITSTGITTGIAIHLNEDFDYIEDWATSGANCYIGISAGAIKDLAGNGIEEILPDNAIAITIIH